ncbi:hypothetical protein COW36_13565 [bacterium (Candidatus Blackallbacteria) CG17_big_fil_post_rev_8_21_14_2_50_48_46]|uniref:Type II secretion system protein GspE N-terminal domain-containing protein n=1 Tax=bacterium (Candidatus Blackallbacteria) CG17_big_fil_post_rev_8_21_14_2_50_48_46 TaxID=2014261 RepID=A0A2M7G3E3_9BACT|nr:MAG: hypothetical protein COW64_22185 [bacterium (Candidatus Blackallbacteria) CG18_big_fil_WC_8_21_14_2_50_49_26]PIW16352.1 MAG: hypothetical protein COW36_13565 [bacterium (Candidatus Blackallbacteria) CG17_big_fil_post_rev_8_21_14_2_50_48_46]PIW45366.1 MAG: hypothetical protein COW20_20800 [bacterium (Candidatus Blackallbacteria) CG13_big_fil_rev_8_21_14_2_50_49_14]
MDLDNTYIQNLCVDAFQGFGATVPELISFALDEVGLMNEKTLVNGKSARELAEHFYRKRNRMRQNSRLGNLLIQEGIISKEQLISALSYHVSEDVPLGEALLQLNFCTPEHLEWGLKQQATLRKQMR